MTTVHCESAATQPGWRLAEQAGKDESRSAGRDWHLLLVLFLLFRLATLFFMKPGGYVLIARLCDQKTGRRLPVQSDSGRQDDKVMVQQVSINRAPSQQTGR